MIDGRGVELLQLGRGTGPAFGKEDVTQRAGLFAGAQVKESGTLCRHALGQGQGRGMFHQLDGFQRCDLTAHPLLRRVAGGLRGLGCRGWGGQVGDGGAEIGQIQGKCRVQRILGQCIDHSLRQCRLALQHRPGRDQRQRLFQPDQARQPLRPARAGHHAKRHLGQADHGRRRGDPVTAGKRDLIAATECRAIDRSDGGQFCQRVQHVGQLRIQRRAVEFLRIGPGDEAAPGPGHDHPLDPASLQRLARFGTGGQKAGPHRLRDHVHRRVVHGQDQGIAAIFAAHGVGHGRAFQRVFTGRGTLSGEI